jgi:deoxyhypusine synthase
MKTKDFINLHYRHFNAAVVRDVAEAYVKHLSEGKKMMVTLAGAMSTAELGISLAEMIRQDKVHAIVCTGANLEEDIFNLVAHEHYKRVPHYRSLSAKDEQELYDLGFNRVTDTCIPEEHAIQLIRDEVYKFWKKADDKGEAYFPYEFMYQILKSGDLKAKHQIDPKHSWLIAACEKNLPIWVPGWEDSTLGNMFVAHVKKGELKSMHTVKTGLHAMSSLIDYYTEQTKRTTIGFFQIGGGIAGDFPICVVPLIRQDMETDVPLWSFFAQISDSTTSYGSYSGAVPNEKITWGKLSAETPKFVIESDATIVVPLIFSYILDQ